MLTFTEPFVPTEGSADSVRFAPPLPAAQAPAAKPPRDDGALAEVLRHPAVWRRGHAAAATIDAQPTGLADLDALLPGGGWPRGALSEILIEHDGIGECSLLLPALAALTRARRRIALVAPPYVPYAPALAAAGVDLDQRETTPYKKNEK